MVGSKNGLFFPCRMVAAFVGGKAATEINERKISIGNSIDWSLGWKSTWKKSEVHKGEGRMQKC